MVPFLRGVRGEGRGEVAKRPPMCGEASPLGREATLISQGARLNSLVFALKVVLNVDEFG